MKHHSSEVSFTLISQDPGMKNQMSPHLTKVLIRKLTKKMKFGQRK